MREIESRKDRRTVLNQFVDEQQILLARARRIMLIIGTLLAIGIMLGMVTSCAARSFVRVPIYFESLDEFDDWCQQNIYIKQWKEKTIAAQATGSSETSDSH